MPKISIILPSYNSAPYLKEALESVFRQSYGDFELIVINDGSTDNTADILKGFSDSRLRLISNTANLGIVESLNEGLKIAKGDYIARFDADDLMLPERLKEQGEFLDKHPEIIVVGSWAETIDHSGQPLGNYDYPPLDDRAIRRRLLKHNPFIHSSTMLRREPLLSCGGYRKAFQHIEDYELWTRLLRLGAGANIPERLIKYRLNQGGITKRKNMIMKTKGLLVRILAWYRIKQS